MVQIEASVVIPTYNRKNTLKLSLLAFNQQEINLERFEVIIIDDCSTDGTVELVNSLDLHFPVQIVRNKTNKGAAAARNLGLQKARGEVIIFSDSDMLVPADFVQGHLHCHKKAKDEAICCVFRWRRVFSVYYEGFDIMQKNEFTQQIRDNPYMQKRLAEIDFHYENEQAIITEDSLALAKHLSYLPSWSEEYLGAIVLHYGYDLQGFAFPWVLFGTGNSSVRKEHLLALEGFDEQFLREEDWELGYRLFKRGLKFKCRLEMESAHQEHPILSERQTRMFKGYEIFFVKHPETIVWLMALHLDNSFNWIVLSEGYKQYNFLKNVGGVYQLVIEKFDYLAKIRATAFVQRKKKTEQFMNISYELGLLKPVQDSCKEFLQLYQELARRMVGV